MYSKNRETTYFKNRGGTTYSKNREGTTYYKNRGRLLSKETSNYMLKEKQDVGRPVSC